MPVYHSKLTTVAFPLAIAVPFLAIMAQLSIDLPWHDLQIPITGQSLAVLLVGYILGKKLGPIAILLYLLLGILGAPIFAKGNAGWEVLLKGSGGFLYGFVFAAALMGQFRGLGWGRHFTKALVAMALGTLVILCFGVLHLSYLYGFEKALEYGFYPFWRGAIVKVIIGALLLPLWYRMEKAWNS